MLIREETTNVQYKVLSEGVSDGQPSAKKYVIEGIFLQADKLNRNGRRYPREIMARELERYTKNYINENRAFGELGHPEGAIINLDRVSHMCTSLVPDGSNWIGRAKILDTPYGKIVKAFMDEGAKLGVSSRGLGSLHKVNGVDVVGDDYFLAAAADIVADPSAPDAFVRNIMENKDTLMGLQEAWVPEFIEKSKRSLENAHRQDREEIQLRLLEKFFSKTRKS